MAEGGGGVPYIGSRISLISKKDIRYEGILYNINTQEATVALQNVRSFGTEDRLPAGAPKIPASASIFDYIIFKGADIKDLHVCEAAAAPTNSLPDDPAIVSSKMAPPPPAPSAATPAKAPATAPATAPVQQPKKQKEQPRQKTSNKKTSDRPIPGMGGHLLHRKERGATTDGKGPDSALTGDFDFEQNLGGFDKEAEFSKLNLDGSSATTNTDGESEVAAPLAYKKSSFFDTISCDALDRLDGRNDGRLRGAAERQLNTETFGSAGLNTNRSRYYRRGGGRGGNRGRRGGRRGGGGRGGGRGGRGNNRRSYGNGGLPPSKPDESK